MILTAKARRKSADEIKGKTTCKNESGSFPTDLHRRKTRRFTQMSAGLRLRLLLHGAQHLRKSAVFDQRSSAGTFRVLV